MLFAVRRTRIESPGRLSGASLQKVSHMRLPLVLLVGLTIGLAGCLPQPATPVNLDDQVATIVSGTLTAEAPLATVPALATDTPPPTGTEVPTLAPPTETPSPTPTASPTITETAAAGDPRTALGQPTWRDPFDSTSGWNLGDDSFTDTKIEDGKFILTGLSTADGWRLTWPEVDDVYLEATTRTQTCQGSDEYGLMFRVPDVHTADKGYLFGFTCDGRYFLRAWDGEDMKTLVPSTASAAIQSGSDKTNRIGVWTEGENLSLYANGTLLVKISDDTFTDKGGFGFFVGARKTEKLTIESNEMAYWDLP